MEAVAVARRLGDPRLLLRALRARWAALNGPDLTKERGEVGSEFLRVAAELDSQQEVAFADGLIAQEAALAGDMSAFDRYMDHALDILSALRSPVFPSTRLFTQVLRAQLAGRFDEYEARAYELAEELRRLYPTPQNAEITLADRLFTVRREQGRLAEVAPMLDALDIEPENVDKLYIECLRARCVGAQSP